MTHDRLPDSMLLDTEVLDHDKLVLGLNTYSKREPVKKCICAYPMYTPKGNTKVVVIVNTDNAEVMQEALARDWSHTKMIPMEPYSGALEWHNDEKLNALYIVLEEYKFTTDIEAKTNNRLYKWQDWMSNLL